MYELGSKIIEIPVSFITSCQTSESFEATKNYDGSIEFGAFSQLFVEGAQLPSGLYGYRVYLNVYQDGVFLEKIYLNDSGTEYTEFTIYYLKYKPISHGLYDFEVYYEHNYQVGPELVLTTR